MVSKNYTAAQCAVDVRQSGGFIATCVRHDSVVHKVTPRPNSAKQDDVSEPTLIRIVYTYTKIFLFVSIYIYIYIRSQNISALRARRRRDEHLFILNPEPA